ncbi:MAG: glycosyltransferase [Coriobacteriia bacterium]|nr:glycosyltransferase [Coriobacteriia bacterium]
MKAGLTVVIPTLNEAQRLPRLLDMLAAQTRPAEAIVVADAQSTDSTRAIAESRGAIVVEGGRPAAGRNAGAAVATTELILFLDADDEPDSGFIERAASEFLERELGCAAGQIEPVERNPANIFACDAANLYLLLMQHIAPHAPGFCILVRRDVHEAIGGFDEAIVLAEDHEYAQRAAKVAKFRVLRTAAIRTSMRRIEKEGLPLLAIKYLYCEMYAVTGRPIYDAPFEYEFAAFDEEAKGPRLLALPSLKEQLEKLAEPVAEVSADVRERLRALATDIPIDTFDTLLHDLAPDELRQLELYVARRVDVARRMPPIVLWRIRRKGETAWRRLTGR